MLNKEKYKDELEDILAKTIAVSKSGKIYKCTDRGNCKDCIFCKGACIGEARKWLNSEYKEQILDDVEKRYLRGVIRPFRNMVEFIKKTCNCGGFKWIEIAVKGNRTIVFPGFKNDEMYKGMELEKEYTLEELGL